MSNPLCKSVRIKCAIKKHITVPKKEVRDMFHIIMENVPNYNGVTLQ